MKSHDPLGLIPNNCATIGIQWTYLHQTIQEEIWYQNVDSLEDVFPINKTSKVEVVLDFTILPPKQTQQENEVAKSPLKIAEEKLVK